MQHVYEGILPTNGVSRLQTSYLAVGEGQSFVRIHRLRAQLGWPAAHFDATLAQLCADRAIELHGGDPSSLSPEELAQSYQDAQGQLYLTLSWRA